MNVNFKKSTKSTLSTALLLSAFVFNGIVTADNVWSGATTAVATSRTGKVSIGSANAPGTNSVLLVAGGASVGSASTTTVVPICGLAVVGGVTINSTSILPGTNSFLQINGGAAIGYSARQTVPTNGLMVNGAVAIGLPAGQALPYSGLYVQGAIGIAKSPDIGVKLDVAGKIAATSVSAGALTATSVKINNWTIEAPDYVFEKEYKLPSLKEVELQILSEKHLSNIPSAAEMKAKGVDLSEMNMAILQKVEELTLYLIEQNKKIEDLEKKVAQKQ